MNFKLRALIPVLVLAGAVFAGYGALAPERADAQCTTTLGEPVLVCVDRPIPGVTSGTNGCLSGVGYVEQTTITTCEGGDVGGGGGPQLVVPTADLSADPTSISQGSSSTLRAESEEVSSCSIDNGVGTVTPNTPNLVSVSPSQSTTYTLTCTAYDGSTLTDSATVSVTASPDLVGQVGGVASATFSQAITLYGGVANQGAADAGYFPNIIQVCDENCANINSILWATPAESLAAGGWQQVATSYTPYSYNQQYYRVCANKNTNMVDVHPESNYANNCSGWQYLNVGTPAPDLTAGAVTPTSATLGQTRTLSATISNIGNAAAGASASYFEVQGPTAKASGTTVAAQAAIGAGGTGTVSYAFTFSAEGSYNARACADWNGSVPESNEGNNCGPWTPIAIADVPNASSVSCTVNTTAVVPGGSVTYSANPSGGAGAPYGWTASDGGSYGSGSTVTRTFSAAGPYDMSVTATGAASSSICPRVNVAADWCTGTSPDLTITATPNRVRTGQTATLTWSATGVPGQNAICTVTGPGVSWTSTVSSSPSCSAGSSATVTVQTQSVYTLTCGSATETAVVNVIPNVVEF